MDDKIEFCASHLFALCLGLLLGFMAANITIGIHYICVPR